MTADEDIGAEDEEEEEEADVDVDAPEAVESASRPPLFPVASSAILRSAALTRSSSLSSDLAARQMSAPDSSHRLSRFPSASLRPMDSTVMYRSSSSGPNPRPMQFTNPAQHSTAQNSTAVT